MNSAESTKGRNSRIQLERHNLGSMFSSWQKEWHVFVVISVERRFSGEGQPVLLE